jgi:hypothetical protein
MNSFLDCLILLVMLASHMIFQRDKEVIVWGGGQVRLEGRGGEGALLGQSLQLYAMSRHTI